MNTVKSINWRMCYLASHIYWGMRLGKECVIGAKIIPGVSLDDCCVIGANAVVTHDVPECAVVAGVPAKVIGYNTVDKCSLC